MLQKILSLVKKFDNQGLSEHWSRNAVVYQIYPLSFKDSNADGKGDLGGIIEKIDYLNGSEDSLGINAVWLSPFYKSPMADFGYDISDFTSIDPVFGDMDTFDRLVEELHKRNIKLIIDYVGNHTSSEHPWFVESKSSLKNPKRDWYVWRDGKSENEPPNNWMSVFGGSAWEFDKETKQYYMHSFLKAQPDLNWRNPEVQKVMMEVIDFWVAKGVDGFRIDAVQHFVEDKKLKNDSPNPEYRAGIDDPYKTLVHNRSQGDIEKMNIVGDFVRQALERHRDIFIVSEAYVDNNGLQKFYDLCRNRRFAPFNFNLIGQKWDASLWKKVIDEYQSILSEKYLPNYVLGNHDVGRLASRLGKEKSRVAAFLQHTLPGMPFIYYGEELGMQNGNVAVEEHQDFLVSVFGALQPGRDLERTPMQWDDSLYAGFSTVKPWLPVGDNYKLDNVAREKNDPDSMFSLYKSLISLRKNNQVLRYGDYIPRQANSANVFTFERKLGDVRFLIYVNFGENFETENLPTSKSAPSIILSTDAKGVATENNIERTHGGFLDLSGENPTLKLRPLSGYVVRL